MTQLALEPVGQLPLLALEAGDLQAQVVDQGAADETTHGMRLPIGGAHDLGHGGTVGAFEQPDDVRLLRAGACSRFARPGAVLAACFALRSRVAASVLERLPDAAHGRLAIGEPLDCSCTRKAIPDADQASRRPRFRQLRKLVKAAEMVRSLGFVGADRSGYVIVR